MTEAGGDVAAKTRRLGHHLTRAHRASGKRLSALALRTDSATRELKALVAKVGGLRSEMRRPRG